MGKLILVTALEKATRKQRGAIYIQFKLRSLFACVGALCCILSISRVGGWFIGTVAVGATCIGVGLSRSRLPRTVLVCGGLAAICGVTIVLDILTSVMATTRQVSEAVVIVLLFAAPLVSGSGWRRRTAAVTLSLSALCTLPLINWDSRKPFRRAFAAIHRGMTLDELEAEFLRQSWQVFPTRRYEANKWYIILDPSSGDFNGEVIVVSLQDGRVLEAEYFPD